MLLTIKTTHNPAKDIGWIFHKNPKNLRTINWKYGKLHIFYPKLSDEVCEIALLMEINIIDIIRSSRNKKLRLDQYVNDRPFVSSSFLSVAMTKAFGSAIQGKCDEKPELAKTNIPIEVNIPVLPSPNGGEIIIKKLFEPLGYKVKLKKYLLDKKFPSWGEIKIPTI
ncbi:MAG: hypothetical protein GY830_08980 [Bacteroidetes bacterium]|nr:hypothetical protein [Bacteroidota bacterium]